MLKPILSRYRLAVSAFCLSLGAWACQTPEPAPQPEAQPRTRRLDLAHQFELQAPQGRLEAQGDSTWLYRDAQGEALLDLRLDYSRLFYDSSLAQLSYDFRLSAEVKADTLAANRLRFFLDSTALDTSLKALSYYTKQYAYLKHSAYEDLNAFMLREWNFGAGLQLYYGDKINLYEFEPGRLEVKPLVLPFQLLDGGADKQFRQAYLKPSPSD